MKVRPAPEVNQPTYEVVGTVERYDQRDHPNARAVLVPGTPDYEDYYSRRPEYKEWDNENKRLRAKALERFRVRDPVNRQLGPAVFYGRHVLGLQSIVEATINP